MLWIIKNKSTYFTLIHDLDNQGLYLSNEANLFTKSCLLIQRKNCEIPVRRRGRNELECPEQMHFDADFRKFGASDLDYLESIGTFIAWSLALGKFTLAQTAAENEYSDVDHLYWADLPMFGMA